jgi:hypothetical protein
MDQRPSIRCLKIALHSIFYLKGYVNYGFLFCNPHLFKFKLKNNKLTSRFAECY